MNCEYVREHYRVPACIGRVVSYKGRKGVISEDRGHYIGVTFDDYEPGAVSNFHPETEGLEYLGMGKVRKISRGRKNYRDYREFAGAGVSFAEWMGFKRKERSA